MKESAPRKTPKSGRGNFNAKLRFLVTHQTDISKSLPTKKGINRKT